MIDDKMWGKPHILDYMKKILAALILVPAALCGVCRDCDFPYRMYLQTYHEHYKHMMCSNREKFTLPGHFEISEEDIFHPEDIETDRERAIFYSGCMMALEQIMNMEEMY